MQFNWAFIDLDGTLLNRFKNISYSNLKALRDYSKSGGEIVITTGRWPVSAFIYNKKIEHFIGKNNRFLIALNGALVYEITKDKANSYITKPIYKNNIDPIVFDKVFSYLDTNYYSFIIYTENGIAKQEVYGQLVPLKGFLKFIYHGNIKEFDYLNQKKDPVYKILVFAYLPKKIKDLYNELKHNFATDLNCYFAGKNALEITAIQASKGKAVNFLKNKYKLAARNIAALGDSYNDISMFNQVGLKIAFKSNKQELSQSANYVFYNNHKDEFSSAINDLLMRLETKAKQETKPFLIDFDFNFDTFYHINVEKYFNVWSHLLNQKPIAIRTKYPTWINKFLFKNFFINENLFLLTRLNSFVYSLKERKFFFAKSFSDTQVLGFFEFLKRNKNAIDLVVIQIKNDQTYFLSTNKNKLTNFCDRHNLDWESLENKHFIQLDDFENTQAMFDPKSELIKNIISISFLSTKNLVDEELKNSFFVTKLDDLVCLFDKSFDNKKTNWEDDCLIKLKKLSQFDFKSFVGNKRSSINALLIELQDYLKN